MLAAMEACAHATHGDTQRCLKALSAAERALGRSNPAQDPGWLDFDEGGLAGHIARSLRDLNRPREADQEGDGKGSDGEDSRDGGGRPGRRELLYALDCITRCSRTKAALVVDWSEYEGQAYITR
jgi:hypothetical protein